MSDSSKIQNLWAVLGDAHTSLVACQKHGEKVDFGHPLILACLFHGFGRVRA